MASNKFYWIKLKTNFFDRDDIDFILSQKNGCQYIVLYQMLCMKSANNEGILGTKINEMIIPYDIDKIVRDTKYFDFDTVSIALELFKKLGLIYEEENNVLKISEYNDMVGSETKWAEKKRIYRAKQNEIGHQKDNVLEEIDIEKEIDIEIDKDKDINIKLLFNLFWKSYPKKLDKGRVEKWFVKNRPSKELVDLMIKQVERFKQTEQWKKEDGKYIPYPSTWLNAKCWEDEFETEVEKEERMLKEIEEKYKED